MEREELWDLQEDRESKVSREILALKESREKKVKQQNNVTNHRAYSVVWSRKTLEFLAFTRPP